MAQVINFNIGQHDWPPYIISDSKDHKGIMIDVFTSIAEELNHKIMIHQLSPQRGLQSIELGEVDAIPRAMEWVEYPEKYNLSEPVINSQDVMIFRTGHVAATLDQLKRKVICTVIGYQYPQLSPLFAKNE